MTNNKSLDKYCSCLGETNYSTVLNETDPIRHLLEYSIFHAYTVCTLGTICNIAALWCITTCNKTGVAVKVLMGTVFTSLLLLSLVTRPIVALNFYALLQGEESVIPPLLKFVSCFSYIILSNGEMWCIAIVAVFRNLAVWSPRRHKISLSFAVKTVVSLYTYILLSTIGVFGYLMYVDQSARIWFFMAYFFCNILLPVLVTLICYAAIIVAVQRNKRRLQRLDSKGSGVMDQAMWAIFAVFTSNLLMEFPHSVYHFLPSPSFAQNVIFHNIFSCHFFVDPIMFLWFNSIYRKRIVDGMSSCMTFLKGFWTSSVPARHIPSHAVDSVPSSDNSTSSVNKEVENVALATYHENGDQNHDSLHT